jgi:hypothetical protein
MAGHWTDLFSFVTGTVRYRDLAYLARVSDEMAAARSEHGYFSEWDNGTWGMLGSGATSWTPVDATTCQHPVEQGLFLGLGGEVLCAGSGDVHEEHICEGKEDSPENRGMMRGIRAIEGKAFAVGMQRQVYRRDAANVWTCIDQTARPEPGDENVYSFEGIDGFSQRDIYAAGRRGEIWRYDGRLWKKQESPTNMILTRVCCAGDGNVYACGRVGMLIRGRDERWEQIEHDRTKDDFWGIAWYNDHLYLSTMRGVFVLEDSELKPVSFGKDRPSSCFALSAADGLMWSIGAKDVMAFDGKEWTRID